MTTINELKAMRANGEFHHATYRDVGSLWEGLWIYVNADDGFRGFKPGGVFYKDDPNLDAAYEIVRGTGISLGSYGRG